MQRPIATVPAVLALLALFVFASATPHRALADESAADLGVPPVTTPEEPATTAASPAPAEPASPAPPSIVAEPIEAVHRPQGAWGHVAAAADLLVMRPLGFVSLAAGGAAFVLVSPVAAATGTIGDRIDTLKDRADQVFHRPLGAL